MRGERERESRDFHKFIEFSYKSSAKAFYLDISTHTKKSKTMERKRNVDAEYVFNFHFLSLTQKISTLTLSLTHMTHILINDVTDEISSKYFKNLWRKDTNPTWRRQCTFFFVENSSLSSLCKVNLYILIHMLTRSNSHSCLFTLRIQPLHTHSHAQTILRPQIRTLMSIHSPNSTYYTYSFTRSQTILRRSQGNRGAGVQK